MTDNPLKSLYRNKTFYIKLPSNGKFYDSGITLSIDGELGIMPMTAKDEIILKSPDSLFNGDSLVDIIKSCIPDIKNPKEIPACDIDPIILGIYSATNKEVNLTTKCSHCSQDNDYSMDLKILLTNTEEISDDNVVEINENTKVLVRPYSLESEIKTNIKRFHYKRMEFMMKKIKDENVSFESKREMVTKAFEDAANLTIELISDNIIKVLTINDDDMPIEVTDKKYIKDWVINMDKETHDKVSTKIGELSKNNLNKTVTFKCSSCNEITKTELDINPVNFFING